MKILEHRFKKLLIVITPCLVTLALSFIFGCVSQKPSETKPNIIFIMADDLGYGHLGCYGQEIIQTPNIDKLASEGLRFTQAYSGCSLCAPSRSVLMTGLHSGHTSVRGNGGGVSLPESDETIAMVLKNAGYATGIFGKWGLGETETSGTPNKKGFDEFFGYLHQLHAQFYYPEYLWENENKFFIPENADNNCGKYAHDLIMEKAFGFVRKHLSKPFFLYLPLTIPHHEFVAPAEALEKYSGKFEEHPLEHWRDGYALPREPRATLAAMITHMDKSIGQLTALLKELNIDENTIIFFTSDNGAADGPLSDPEFFKANGLLRGLKGSFYEGGIRVPFIAHWPGQIKSGSTTSQVIYFPDIFTTLAELANVSKNISGNTDGISFLPALTGGTIKNTHDFLYWENSEYNRISPFLEIPGTREQAVLMGNWKAVKNSPVSAVELYDLSVDIVEQNDLAAERPDITRKMEGIMQKEHQPAPPQVDMAIEDAQKLYIPEVPCR